MKDFLQQININPYLKSKDFFNTLHDDNKEIFLVSLFDILREKNIVFCKFLESHPYFENYLMTQNLKPYNLEFLEDDINIMYAAMQQKQEFLPNIIYNSKEDSKNITNIILFEPFNYNITNNLINKIMENNQNELRFFIVKQTFLREIRNVIETQKMINNNELDENLVESLILLAQKFNASDIHLTLQSSANNAISNDLNKEIKGKDSICLFRMNGNLVRFFDFSNELFLKLSKKMKLLCKIDINDKEVPQDGHFKTEGYTENSKFHNNYLKKDIDSITKNDIRISFLPTLNGESIAIRIPSQNKKFHNLEKLNMQSDIALSLKKNLSAKSGLIIISGPTNSAKTTLLYAALRYLNDGKRKILSIEDPIEQEIVGIAQCQVNKNETLSFANALKYVLRQDGDVIMIGEIRDGETLDLSLKAALSGHLVLASIHASDCISSISRMLDLNAQKGLLDSVLKCVISQRLLKTLCPFCKEEIDGKFVAKGCYKCYYQGFEGRKLIQEMIDFRGQKIQNLAPKNLESNENKIIESKIDYVLNLQESSSFTTPYFSKTLQEQAFELYTQGIINYEESLL